MAVHGALAGVAAAISGRYAVLPFVALYPLALAVALVSARIKRARVVRDAVLDPPDPFGG